MHYDPAVNSEAYASSVLDDAEQAWARLVSGGGGKPNAGLQGPPSDNGAGGDNLVDVYLVTQTRCGSTAIGCSATDPPIGTRAGSIEIINNSAYTGEGVAHVAAHEFMHLIQFGYGGGPLMEEGAEWAAYWTVPNQIQFMPDTSGWSIDCHDTSSTYCGYDQWTFVERQVEDYGVGFVDTMTRQAGGRSGIRNAISIASGGRDTLGNRYASYARQLWDPTAWQGPLADALGRLQSGQNFATPLRIGRSAEDSGEQRTQVNQLAARYVRVTDGHAVPTGPADQLRISVGDPAIATPTSVLIGGTDGHRTEVPLSACGALRCATVPFDQASVADVVIPLVNDNDPTSGSLLDGLPFTWRVELLPGAATPPANDSRTAPASATLGQAAGTDNAYASGTGATEATGCSSLSGSYRGVWYRFRTASTGVYRFDSSSSDFPPVVAVYGSYGPIACGGSTAQVALSGGAAVDVYVAHAASATLTGGHAARLLVTATPLRAPSNQVGPSISPSSSMPVGTTLGCWPGTWDGMPSYSYAWLRDAAAIRGAAAGSYRTVTADAGHRIRCRITATNSLGSSSADSSSVAVTNAGSVTIRRISVKGTTASVPLACGGSRGQTCTITLRLTIKIGRKTVTLASAKVALVPGRSKTVRLTLNAQGRRLLSQRHTLKPKLTISQMRDGRSRTLSTRTLRFQSSSRKARIAALNSFGASTFAM